MKKKEMIEKDDQALKKISDIYVSLFLSPSLFM